MTELEILKNISDAHFLQFSELINLNLNEKKPNLVFTKNLVLSLIDEGCIHQGGTSLHDGHLSLTRKGSLRLAELLDEEQRRDEERRDKDRDRIIQKALLYVTLLGVIVTVLVSVFAK